MGASNNEGLWYGYVSTSFLSSHLAFHGIFESQLKMKAEFLFLALPALSLAAQVTFTNTRRLLFDVDGEQIDAYGSKINRTLYPFLLDSFPLMTI